MVPMQVTPPRRIPGNCSVDIVSDISIQGHVDTIFHFLHFKL